MRAHKPELKSKTNRHGNRVFSVDSLTSPARRLSWKIMLPVWCALLGIMVIGHHYHLEPHILGGGVVLLGIFSSAFTWLVGIVGLAPLVGPLLVKVLALPIIWVLNAIGSIISYVAIRRGYTRDVLTYRGLTIALIVGVVIGYVIGKFV